jgi:cytochrome c oxidase subunit 1
LAEPAVEIASAPARAQKSSTMPPVVRGLLWALIGFLVGDLLIYLVDPITGHPFVTEVGAVVGWVGAVIGWILGVGGLEEVVYPLLGIQVERPVPTGWRRYFAFSTDHKVIGLQYLVTSVGSFGLAGLLAMWMRAELMSPGPWTTVFQFPEQYLNVVGIHGSLMIFSVATVAMVGGLGNYFVPLMIGSRETVFRRASGISFWLVPAGILTIAVSPVLGYWTSGWRGYEPLLGTDPSGAVYYYLGVAALLLSSYVVAINLVATILFRRAPGLTWNRIPMFVWGILVTSLLNLIWLPEIITTFLLALIDRTIPFHFFDSGGSPLTYLNLFWLFGHPEVYIIVLPALALWQEILPVMGRKSLFARNISIIGLSFVMLLSGLVWGHHMFTNMSNEEMLGTSFFTEMISIPTGFAFLSAIGTLWNSRLRLTTPALLVLMSMFNFLIGGLTGLFLADVPVNFQIHNTFWVIGHFHYTIIGGMVFSLMAAMYYWLPKFSGRMYNEAWGKFLAVLVFVAFNWTFGQMFILGLDGMPRWVPVYPRYLQGLNDSVSIGAFVLGLGFILTAVHIWWAWVKGPKSEPNPWAARTLEWFTDSPPPEENFREIPVVAGSFYVYGEDTPAAVLTGPAGGPSLPA